MNWIKIEDEIPEVKGLILVNWVMQYGPNWSIPNMKENQWEILTAYFDERVSSNYFWVKNGICSHVGKPTLDSIITNEYLISRNARWIRLHQEVK